MRPTLGAVLLAAVLAAGAFLGAACGGPGGEAEGPEELLVFAAASLRDGLQEVGTAFERRHPGARLVFNFAGSNTLAQQIVAAPRADLFLSADTAWVDFLEQKGLTVPGESRDFLSNRLVVVGHEAIPLRIATTRDLVGAPFRFLALAGPEGVPAGRYARVHLESVEIDGSSLWQVLESRVVPALDVRAALALVESDPEILGIVYRTDALTSSRVRVLLEIPTGDHPPITYRAALLTGGRSPALASDLLDFLAGPEAGAIWRRHGFLTEPA